MNRALIAVVCLLLSAIPCHAGQPQPFQFYKDVDRGESQEEEVLEVTLDSDVYAATQDDFVDLRVIDAQGEAVPFRIEKGTEARSETVRRTCPCRVVSLVENDNNSIDVVVAREKDSPTADGMTFRTPLKDFERRVSIFGSTDGKQWQPLVEAAMIYDYSRYMDVRNSEIALPENQYRRFKIVIEEVTDLKESTLMRLSRQFRAGKESQRTEQTTVQRRPLRVDSIELWHNTTKKLVKKDIKTAYPIIEFGTEEDDEKKHTIVEVSTHREPLTAFMLETNSANFSRSASVQIPVTKGVTTDWVEVGRARISVVRFRDFERKYLKLLFPQQRQAKYRIVIENEDNAPLQITGVAVEGNVYRAMFIATEDATYRVCYGYEEAEKPNYDTAALSVALGEGFRPASGSLGPQTDNPDFSRGRGLGLNRVLDNPFFLGAVICLMVIVLALILFRAGRRIEGLTKE